MFLSLSPSLSLSVFSDLHVFVSGSIFLQKLHPPRLLRDPQAGRVHRPTDQDSRSEIRVSALDGDVCGVCGWLGRVLDSTVHATPPKDRRTRSVHVAH